jgi:protease IV
VLASERIRLAIERHKAKGIPIVVSMANLAASGGYWVSTPASTIFAEPATITGSIGIFGVIPTFEATLGSLGINADGVRTTPLSGQPDFLGGLTPELETMVQAQIEHGYRRFVGLVAASRGKPAEEIDRIAQGRVWDGGTARQLGLVDRFGGLEEALAFAAAQAKLGEGAWHPVWLGQEDDLYQTLLAQMVFGNDDDESSQRAASLLGLVAERESAMAARLRHDLARLLGGSGMQAYCLECPAISRAGPFGRSERAILGELSRLLVLGR